MKINFVLPFDGARPVGGLKVVYEYANHLALRGHLITLIHTAGLGVGSHPNIYSFRKFAKYVLYGITRKYLPSAWFDLDKRIIVKWVPSLAQYFIPKGEVIIATAWITAEWVAKYSTDRGKKFYLIQHFEDWDADKNRVEKTWRLPLRKIVISSWLEKIAKSMQETACLVPNGLDFEAFGIDAPIVERNKYNLLMLYHKHPWKGVADGLSALSIVRSKYPSIKLTLFGVDTPDLTEEQKCWITFVKAPSGIDLRNLYNQAAIFIAPSWSEGWGLTPCEAMLCGCAVAMTAANGHTEFGQNNLNALMSPPQDIGMLAENITILVEQDELRHRLAFSAPQTLNDFTWERAAISFEACLLACSE